MTRFAVALIAGLALTGINASAEVQKKDVDIKTSDGLNLKGTSFSPGTAGPAILFLHQCNMDRHAWDGLAGDLANAGFHVLTVDFRGMGESGQTTADPEQRRAARTKWSSDVDTMFNYLLAQQGVDKSRLAAGGASCGVRESAELAARRPEIKALVELSGMGSETARAYVAKTPALAVFGAAAEGDNEMPKTITALVEASKNPRSTLKIYAGTEHGVPMFAKNPDLQPMIVAWLKTQFASRGTN